MWKHAILALAAWLAAAPAFAQDRLSDVLVFERDGRHVWLALEGAPHGLSAAATPGRLVLTLEGFAPQAERRITPASDTLVTAITLSPQAGGASLVVEGRFQSAVAELRQGGVWVSFEARASGETWRMGQAADPQARSVPAADMSGGPAALYDRTVQPSPDTWSAGLDPGAASSIAGASEARDGTVPQDSPDDRDEFSPGPALPALAEQDLGSAQPAPEVGAVERANSGGRCAETARVVGESPWDLAAMTLHADCLVETESQGAAAALYERVLAFDPTHFRAAIGLARIREAQGRSAEAAGLYERAASAALTDGEALSAQGAARRNAGGG